MCPWSYTRRVCRACVWVSMSLPACGALGMGSLGSAGGAAANATAETCTYGYNELGHESFCCKNIFHGKKLPEFLPTSWHTDMSLHPLPWAGPCTTPSPGARVLGQWYLLGRGPLPPWPWASQELNGKESDSGRCRLAQEPRVQGQRERQLGECWLQRPCERCVVVVQQHSAGARGWDSLEGAGWAPCHLPML